MTNKQTTKKTGTSCEEIVSLFQQSESWPEHQAFLGRQGRNRASL